MAGDATRTVVGRLVYCAGFALLALCVVAVVRRQDVLAGGLAVLGLGAIVLGVLMPRLTGPVEMGLSGFKMQLADLAEIVKPTNYTRDEFAAAVEDLVAREHIKWTGGRHVSVGNRVPVVPVETVAEPQD